MDNGFNPQYQPQPNRIRTVMLVIVAALLIGGIAYLLLGNRAEPPVSRSDDEDESYREEFEANQAAVSQELNNYGAMCIQWWKTPMSQGGAGQQFPGARTGDQLASFLGFGQDMSGVTQNESGMFKITEAMNPQSIVIEGIGKERGPRGYPLIRTTVNLITGTITQEPSTIRKRSFDLARD